MRKKLILYPKLTGIAMFSLIFTITGVFAYFIYLQAIKAVEDEIKAGLISCVAAAATVVDGEQHKKFDSDTKRTNSDYIEAIKPLEEIRQASKNIKYIYTNILKKDKVYFILNPSPQNDNDKDGKPDLPPALMDYYSDAPQALITALKQEREIVSEHPYSDEWGTFYSAYVPFYDNQNKFVGTLGMDLDLEGFDNKLKYVRQALKRTAIVIIIISIFSGTGVWYVLKLASHLNREREKQYVKYASNKKELKSSRKIIKQMVVDINSQFVSVISSQKNKLSEIDFMQLKSSCRSLSFKLRNIISYYNLKTKSQLKAEKSNLEINNILIALQKLLLVNRKINMVYSLSETPDIIFENRDELIILLFRTAELVTAFSSNNIFNLSVVMSEEFLNTFTVDLTFSSKSLCFPFDSIEDFINPYYGHKGLSINRAGIDNYSIPIIFKSLKSLKGFIKINKEEGHSLIMNLTLNKSRVYEPV